VETGADAAGVADCRVEASYRLDAREYPVWNAAYTRRMGSTQAISAMFAVAGLVVLASGDVLTGLVGVLIAILGASGAIAWLFGWLVIRNRRAALERPSRLVADAQGIAFEDAMMSSRYSWHAIRRVRQVGPYWTLEPDLGGCLLVPKAALDGEAAATFESLMRTAGLLP
jgi:hypothetical protein